MRPRSPLTWLVTITTHVVWLVLLVSVGSVIASQPAQRASQLVIAQLGNPTALDGWNWGGTSDQDILLHMQESLVEYDRQANLQLLLAESIDMKSPTEWILKIRRGAKFHDPALGELTAEDVKASIEVNIRKGTSHWTRMPSAIR